MNILILGNHIQSLIAGALMAKQGAQVTIAPFPSEDSVVSPISHAPFALSEAVVGALDLESYGLEKSAPLPNPFESLPFYDGLVKILEMFQSLEGNRPSYNEKAWRDTWGTFEIGRILAEYDSSVQDLFAMKNTLSLADMLDATDLDDAAKANVIAACVIGSKTDPFAPGSAASIIPAMIHYHTPDTYGVYVGNLTNVYNALKQCALAYGVTFIEDRAIKTVLSGESAIEGVVLDNDEEINADYYILDHDPVWFFCDYLTDFSVSPAFRNRIAPDKNLKHTQRVRVVLSELPKGINVRHSLVAPSVDYIKNAYIDTKTDGGPQNPVLSVVSYESSDQGIVLDILAHPFDPHLKEGNATVQAVTDSVKNGLKQIDPDIEEKITATEILSCPTLCGQPNFTGTMPLLQLLKVFFGHHSLAYDMPITNMIMAGYGAHTVSHSHVVNGGIRAANLYESLSEDGKK